MEFINKGEPIKIRVGELGGCYWKTLQTNETIDLPSLRGKALGLFPATTEGQMGNRTVQTKQIKSKPEIFLNELIKIRGIGRKIASDIYTIYPSIKKLTEAIKEGGKLPFRDDIEKLLREKYG